jgi:hypothetical protein
VNGIQVVFTACLLWAVFALPAGCGEPAGRQSNLLRGLTGRSEQVRMRALASVIDPVRRRQALGDLVTAARLLAAETSGDELARPSTVELIYRIGQVDDPESERVLVELLDAQHLGIAMVSADALGKNKFYGAIQPLRQQIDRPQYASSYGFRFNLVRSLAQMEHPDAVEALTELSQALEGQLGYQVNQLLGDVTLSHFLGDAERYEKWKSRDQKRERIFQAAAFEPESLQRVQLERQQYYGIEIHAKRLMYIIDHSGSMREYRGGLTRLERAKQELIRSITELPSDTEFAIVGYHATVHPWRYELVQATEENKREAIAFVRRLGYGVKTNTYGALRLSLEFDDQLEAVFLLTDGEPTVGEIVAPAAIINDLLHRNRFRHLNFNTIGIGLQGPTKTFLQRLAEESNGEFREAG